MTNILDGAAVLMETLLKHDSADCPFCKDDKKPGPGIKSNSDPKWEDDPGEAIGNDADALESNMNEARPANWVINVPAKHTVTPNPHHLIPGNESLKESKILEWIFAGSNISDDIGYDVNNGENGIWLPSNNAMRSNRPQVDPNRSNEESWKLEKVKVAYVVAAMDKSGHHFHDSHGDPYSAFVTKLLNKISDRMSGIEAQNPECPYKTKKQKGGKFSPPYSLISRLNGVSERIAGYLSASAKPTLFLFTSRLVREYWKKKRKVPA